MIETSRLLVERLERQMSANPQSVETRTLAIVPLGDVDVGEFADQLSASLDRYGTVLHLSSRIVDERLGRRGLSVVGHDDPGQLRLGPWLMEQELRHRFVIYQADPSWTGWSDRAVRHADQILLVADGAASGTLGEADAKLAALFAREHSPKTTLVLLHGEGRTFPNTARWFPKRTIERHVHIRRNSRADSERLARCLTGNAISLVLGGGGSRGYAHIGVLRAFEDLGIPIDAIGGTSIGALVAAAAALELGSEPILTMCTRMLSKSLRPTFPYVSLLSGRPVVDGLEQVGGDTHIEDLHTPFFCISTNLTRGTEVRHLSGSLVRAVRASTAVPGIWPPVPHAGDLLVDGGLSNNVPVDTMAELFGGTIVAIDVIPELDLATTPDLPLEVSGWSVAWRRMTPFAKPVGMPNIFDILMRSVVTASSIRRGAVTNLAALYLRPALGRWNLLDFSNGRPVADQGYRETFTDLASWWKTISNRKERHD